MRKHIDKFNNFRLNESFFDVNNFKKVIKDENSRNSKILGELIDEINRVKDLLDGNAKGPLPTEYLNMFLNFYDKVREKKFYYNLHLTKKNRD